MIKVDIISGFLGAGKTTFIKKLLEGPLKGKKVVLIENEYGEIGIDGAFLQESGIVINEITSGCICCSLVGDFVKALKDTAEQYQPDYIIIEPSGVGALSEVISAVKKAEADNMELSSALTLIDVTKYSAYKKVFGAFFNDQIMSAKTILFSRTDLSDVKDSMVNEIAEDVRRQNPGAVIITTPLNELDIQGIFSVMEEGTLPEIAEIHHGHEEQEHHHGHQHDHHEHVHDQHEHEEHGHHHHDDEADEVFCTVGLETARKYTEEEISERLESVSDTERFGTVLRAKGIVPSENGSWIAFDMVPGQIEIRKGETFYTGKISVIGVDLKEDNITELFSK